MPFFLGIDGGGSKSTVAVSDGASVLATHTAGGCNLHTVSSEDARLALHEAVHGALSSAGISARAVTSVCAGVAGATSPDVAAKIAEILVQLLPLAAIQVVPDTAIALEAVFPARPGLVCISGTGSIAFGRNERGELASAGGGGRLISDEGSGNWIGQRALSQCLRALDMGRSCRLVAAIKEYWQIETREQLVQRCNHQQIPYFAELFPVVLAAAEADDLLACEILGAAGIELARLAQIVLHRLWIDHCGVEIAVTGGVFTNSARVRQVFGNCIRADRPEVRIRLSEHQPFEGAVYLARQAILNSLPRVAS